MKINIFIEREQCHKTIEFTSKTVKDLLQQVGINPEIILVVRRGEVLTEDDVLSDQDRIKLLSVISGG